MTKIELRQLYAKAVEMELDKADCLLLPDAHLYCNGIGADWMPDALCDLISTMNPTLKPVAAVHDVEYTVGGTEDDRKAADERFLANGLKAANYEYGWYNPVRYIVRHQAHKYYTLLRAFGGAAWNYTNEEND